MRPGPPRISLAIVFFAFSLTATQAQQPASIGQALNTLADQPATHTGPIFDRSMLQVAQSLLESNGMDAEHTAAAIHSLAVDSYHYPQPAFYTPEAFSGIVATYRAAGWKHLVHGNQITLWLRFTGANIDGVTVLTRASRNMNVIQLSCDLRPLDLLYLSGHFGIPKVDPNAVMVSAPDGR